MPTQIPSSGRPAAARSRSASARPRLEPAGGALGVADAGDDGERRVAHGRWIGGDLGGRACPLERRADAAEVARAVVGEHDLHSAPFRRADTGFPRRARLPERPAERLERRLGDVVVVHAGGREVQRDPALHREALERVREQGGGETADPVAGEGEATSACGRCGRGRPSRVASASSIGTWPSRSGRHRHGRRAPRERVAERGEDVLDGVVLVDLEVARGEQLEVEPAVEGEQRRAGGRGSRSRSRRARGPAPSRSSTIRSAVSVLVRTTSAVRPRRRAGRRAERGEQEVVLRRAAQRDADPLGEGADDEPGRLEPLRERLVRAHPDEVAVTPPGSRNRRRRGRRGPARARRPSPRRRAAARAARRRRSAQRVRTRSQAAGGARALTPSRAQPRRSRRGARRGRTPSRASAARSGSAARRAAARR